jgi:hypothetical protein
MDWEEQTTTSASLGAKGGGSTTIFAGPDRPRPVGRVFATEEFLSILGASPRLGRRFNREVFDVTAPRVDLITESAWCACFRSGLDIAGRVIGFDDPSFIVVGVLQDTVFQFLEQ